MISGNNLKLAIKRLNLKQEEAAVLIGVSRQTVNSWIGKAELDKETVKLINERLKVDLSDFHINPEIIKPNGKIISNNKNRRKDSELIPFYNADFIAGNANENNEEVIIHPEYYMDVPDFYGCTAFNAYSDSMEKLIPAGCILFGTKLEDWRSHIEYGKIYGIVCTDGRKYLKYIRRAKDNDKIFILKSENEAYDDMDMPVNKIKNIWLIDGWLVRNT